MEGCKRVSAEALCLAWKEWGGEEEGGGVCWREQIVSEARALEYKMNLSWCCWQSCMWNLTQQAAHGGPPGIETNCLAGVNECSVVPDAVGDMGCSGVLENIRNPASHGMGV